jgi:FkbM family methyltransferase
MIGISANMVTLRVIFSKFLTNMYANIIGKKSFERINNKIISMSLHARGYQNSGSLFDTGEEHLLSMLKKHGIEQALDVGANTGAYSRYLLENLNCSVIAIEPLPEAFLELCNLGLEYKNRFQCFQLGCGEFSGNGTLSFGTALSEIATFATENAALDFVRLNNINEIQVEVTSLDDFFHEHKEFPRLDFIKIDVEGFEYQVLLGARETILTMRPRFIQIEHNRYHLFSGQPMYAFSNLLPDYDLYQILPKNKGILIRDPKDPLTNLFEYTNFVFIHKDINL